ncbi:MAG TPA: hypothetical protein VFX97_17010 [Pyrinomonadaceae bacterium]|nr:hypothetical protein [Pyrinomonadaceae bacterium]
MNDVQVDEGKLSAQEHFMISIDDPYARILGFTSDKFHGDSYLFRDGERVMISFIHCKEHGKGYLSGLFAAIESQGLRVAVPTPLGRMEAILRHKGFERHFEPFSGGACEVWEKPVIDKQDSRSK